MSAKRKSNKHGKDAPWTEWEWKDDIKKWARYRKTRGEEQWELQDPQPSSSSTIIHPEASTTTDWTEWEWRDDIQQYVRYRKIKDKDEYEYRHPEPSSTSAREEKGKGKARAGKPKTGNLFVAFYRPRWGNLRHWALYLDSDDYVYEVTGDAMNFTASARPGIIPSKSGSWLESIHVAQIQRADMAELHKIISGTIVQNDIQGWCCQDYVMEALQALNEEQIVDDEDFEKVREKLMEKFNN